MSSRSSYINFSFLVAVLALSACGGKSFDSGGDDSSGGNGGGGTTSGAGTSAGGRAHGGTSAGGGANGGSPHGGTSAGGTTSGGTTSGGSGGTGQCDGFGNESGTTVQVQIRNETKIPIHLGQLTPGCAQANWFSVADATGKELASPGFCPTSCDDVMHGTIRACPAIACALGSAITLQPGETMMTQWSGEFLVNEILPVACRPANGQSDCQRIQGVKAGAFTFSAQAGTKLDCTQFGGDTCSACTPNKEGGCTTSGAVIVAPLLTADAKVMLDGSYGVGGGGGGGEINSVQLVFKN